MQKKKKRKKKTPCCAAELLQFLNIRTIDAKGSQNHHNTSKTTIPCVFLVYEWYL